MTKTKTNKPHEKVLRGFLKELPYFNYKGNLADFHGHFNNSKAIYVQKDILIS